MEPSQQRQQQQQPLVLAAEVVEDVRMLSWAESDAGMGVVDARRLTSAEEAAAARARLAAVALRSLPPQRSPMADAAAQASERARRRQESAPPPPPSVEPPPIYDALWQKDIAQICGAGLLVGLTACAFAEGVLAAGHSLLDLASSADPGVLLM